MPKPRPDSPPTELTPLEEADLLIHFSSYSLDGKNELLWRGQQAIRLTGKAFAVLRHLASRPQALVSKRELLNAVWPDTIVSSATLTSCIKELRKALGDDARTPHYIETVHRRGYRWIALLSVSPPVVSSQHPVISHSVSPPQDSRIRNHSSVMVGRETELAQLQEWYERALAGERKVIFVTGEAGIGKTTLVEAFLAKIWQVPPSTPLLSVPTPQSSLPEVWVGWGQCIEQYGAGEPYRPVLEAFGRLCRGAEKEAMRNLLHRHAPTWLVHMPALLNDEEREMLHRQVGGASRDRMLREMAEALEALSTDRPFILCLEDLQWSDYSTLDLLSVVASRPEPARLLVLGTCRPLEALEGDLPLKTLRAQLQRSGRYQELMPSFLSSEAVQQYLAQRFADKVLPMDAEQLVQRHAEGNPLFMVHVTDYLERQGVFENQSEERMRQQLERITISASESLRQLIECHIEQMGAEEQDVLMAASVAGMEFSAATVAAALQAEDETVEVRCATLARRRQFLQELGAAEWPDGTFGTRYRFLHALYQNILYERTPPGRRTRRHLRIGERLERAYQGRLGEVAAELGVHFEQGRDYRRSVLYLGQAAEHAMWTYAYQEAIDHLTKGVALLSHVPQSPERIQQELTLHLGLSLSLMHIRGFTAPEVKHAYERVRDLVRAGSDSPQRFAALWGLRNFHLLRGELQAGQTVAQEFLEQVQRTEMASLAAEAHLGLGTPLFHLGELSAARPHLEQSLMLYNPHLPQPKIFLTGQDPRASSLAHLAVLLWILGYPDQAQERSRQALTLAQETGFSFGRALTLNLAAILHVCCRDFQTVTHQAEAALTFAQECGFVHLVTMGIVLQGWALVMQGKNEEGITRIQSGLQRQQAAGIGIGEVSYQMLLVDAYITMGQVESARQALTDAFASGAKTGERTFEPELYRLQGRLALQKFQAPSSKPQVSPTPQAEIEAEASFQQAIACARRQNAKSLELRAVMELSRLWRQQERHREAYEMLANVYNWFTEGFDTADLREAQSLLLELERHSPAL